MVKFSGVKLGNIQPTALLRGCAVPVVLADTSLVELARGGNVLGDLPLGAEMSQLSMKRRGTEVACHVIMNPSAGRAHRERLAGALSRCLPSWPVILHAPGTPEEMQSLIRTVSVDEDLVIAGGDGTLQCALPALMDTQHPLVVLPLGTANDFARQWGYSADVLSVYRTLTRGTVKRVDVIQCNEIPFLTVGGLGVGALLTRDFNWLRQRSPALKRALESVGSEIYTALAAATILGRRSYLRNLEIEVNGTICAGQFSNVFICNQNRLGGQLSVAPNANTSDGLVDLLCLRGETPTELIHSLACLRWSIEPHLSERITGDEVKLRATDGKPLLMFADGESFVLSPEIKITVHRQAISLLTEYGTAA